MRITIRSLPVEAWPAAAADFLDLSFEQSCTYAEAGAKRIGARTDYLLLEAEGRPIAAAAVRTKIVPGLGRGIAWIPSGPLISPKGAAPPDIAQISAILSTLRAKICDQSGHILRLRPAGIAPHDTKTFDAAAAIAGFSPTARAPAYTSIAIDLSQDTETRMAALNGKWRTDLRYALKSDLTVEVGTPDVLAARFLKLYDALRDAKDFQPDIPPQFHFALEGLDFPREILLATQHGQDLAGIVVGTAGQTTTYLFGATAPLGRKVRAGYLLTWEGISRAAERGQNWYDLGGVDAKTNPDVARFKQRMNGREIAATPYEVHPRGPVTAIVRSLESMRAKVKKRNRG